MIRVFVAVPVPPEHRRLLGDHLAECSAIAPRFRWVVPANLHLTLRFIGAVELEETGRLGAELAAIRRRPFEMSLGSPGSFGRGNRVRVLWLGVAQGIEALGELADATAAACRRVGHSAEERSFSPHLTLARSRDPRGSPEVTLPTPPDLGPWTVDEFHLYRSDRHPEGATYTPVVSLPLTVPSPTA